MSYLPAAMEPYNNPAVGWIGTIQDIDTFKEAIQKFLTTSAFQGWPQFVDDQGETILKIPSALHIMHDQANLTPAQRLASDREDESIMEELHDRRNRCRYAADIRECARLFHANYASYRKNYARPAERHLRSDERS